jgi:hypothetical protein
MTLHALHQLCLSTLSTFHPAKATFCIRKYALCEHIAFEFCAFPSYTYINVYSQTSISAAAIIFRVKPVVKIVAQSSTQHGQHGRSKASTRLQPLKSDAVSTKTSPATASRTHRHHTHAATTNKKPGQIRGKQNFYDYLTLVQERSFGGLSYFVWIQVINPD